MRKQIITILLIFPLMLTTAAICRGQDECLTLLKEVFRKVSMNDLPEDGKAYCFEYSVAVNMADKSSSSSNVKVYLSKNYMQVLSDQAEIYQDLTNSFTVIPMRKMIYWGDSQLGRKDDAGRNATGDMTLLKEKVLDNSRVKLCRSATGQGYDREIVIEPEAQVKEKFQIQEVRFLINTGRKTIRETLITYTEGSQYRSVLITYTTIDYDCRKAKPNSASKAKIFKSDGTLQPEYAGYKVVDVRASKK